MPEQPSLPTRLPFEIDDRIDPMLVTAHAGVPLVIELFAAWGRRRWSMRRFGSNSANGACRQPSWWTR